MAWNRLLSVCRFSFSLNAYTSNAVNYSSEKQHTRTRTIPLQTGDQKVLSSYPVLFCSGCIMCVTYILNLVPRELDEICPWKKSGRALCGKPSAKLTIAVWNALAVCLSNRWPGVLRRIYIYIWIYPRKLLIKLRVHHIECERKILSKNPFGRASCSPL